MDIHIRSQAFFFAFLFFSRCLVLVEVTNIFVWNCKRAFNIALWMSLLFGVMLRGHDTVGSPSVDLHDLY